MTIKSVTLTNKEGLHGDHAMAVIQKSNEFDCAIWLEKDSRRINAKSLLGMLALDARKGDALTVITDGHNESEVLDSIAALLLSGSED
ncbi:MAG: HPr family phosphocarrier protein [Oscillospiraceae bacterium]|jgi:phosphocarrier protein|nr:HPr family phosphocarrier protein [Oscillospiraceae bacterium]